MDRLRALGRWIGSLPSAGVVAGSYVAVGLTGLLFSDAAGEAAGVAMLAVVAGYCRLRPSRRGDVFGSWLAPGCVSTFTGDFFGIPKAYVGVPIALLVVASLAYADRADQRAAQA